MKRKLTGHRKHGIPAISRGVYAAACLLPAFAVLAHHSTAAFDYTKEVMIKGTVKTFEWTNPHMFVRVQVPQASGKTVDWHIDVGTPNINVRHGWRKTDIKPGDVVTVKMSPMRYGNPEGHLISITLPDNRVLWGPAADIRASAANRR